MGLLDDLRDDGLRDGDPASRGWHLDRRIPIAGIVTVVLALLGQTWFFAERMATTDANVAQHERRITDLEDNRSARRVAENDVNTRLTRVEERVTNQSVQLDRQTDILQDMKQSLDRFLWDLATPATDLPTERDRSR